MTRGDADADRRGAGPGDAAPGDADRRGPGASGDVAAEPPTAGELREAARPGAGEVTATVIVNAPADRVFAALTAWERQSEWIPFTRVRLVRGAGGPGSVIEATTAVGPARLRDEMRVVHVDAPYEVRVVHYGRVLRGPGVLRCTPLGPDRTQVVWHEWFHLPGGTAGRVAWPVLWPGSKIGLTRALKRFSRLVEVGFLP